MSLTMSVTRIAAVVLGAVALAGCTGVQRTPPIQVWPDMRLQDRFEAQRLSESETIQALFEDGRESRRRPEGVVARGHAEELTPFNTGMDGDLYVGRMPVEITEDLLELGETRFNIYCAPCHDRTGLGSGAIPRRALSAGFIWEPQNLMDPRIIDMADGDLFNVITYGRRSMPPYGFSNTPEERWAIIAYVRLLQRAGHGTIEDVPEELRTGVEYKPGPPPPPAPEFDFGDDLDLDLGDEGEGEGI